MSLANMRMIWKVLVLVAIGGAGMAAVSGLAWHGLTRTDSNLAHVASSGQRAVVAAQLDQTVQQLAAARSDALTLSRPTAEWVAGADSRAEAARTRFRQLLATFDGVSEPAQVARIEAIRSGFAALDTSVSETIALSRRAALANVTLEDFQVSAQMVASLPLLTEAQRAARAMMEATLAEKAAQEAAAHATLSVSRFSLLVGVAVSLVVMVLAGWWTATHSVSAPLGRSVNSIQNLAAGRLDAEIAGEERRDEIGDIARALVILRGNLTEARSLQQRQLAAAEAESRRARTLAALTQRFESEAGAVTRSVASSATELQVTATSMSSTADEARRQSGAVVAVTREASGNVQTVAAAAEELSASVSEIARQVTESARVANEAVAEAERTNATVAGLSDAAGRIGDVVRLINDIAGQTNLLALNATIEAARAGEAGKGFAVVASEVKTLASQTARATDEISAQIQAMQAATSQTVSAIGAIGRTIARINEISGAIAAAVEEQGAATADIARNVQAAAQGTSAIDQRIGSVNEAATATGAATAEVLNAAHELSAQAETLRSSVERFLGEMKAA